MEFSGSMQLLLVRVVVKGGNVLLETVEQIPYRGCLEQGLPDSFLIAVDVLKLEPAVIVLRNHLFSWA